MVKLSRFILAVTVALVVAAPAAASEPAKEKEKPAKQIVPVTSSGEGLAPGAPDWVAQHVAEVTATGPEAPASPAGAQVTMAIGCRTVWAYRGYNHWLGYVLIRYYEQVSWCSNGFGIYSFGRDRWPETHVGWQFNGHIGSSITGGSYSRSAWTQGSFSFCIGACYEHKYPWVMISVNADLDWNVNTGG